MEGRPTKETAGALDQPVRLIATKGAEECGCGGMVDATDSKSVSARSVGSSPTTRTKNQRTMNAEPDVPVAQTHRSSLSGRCGSLSQR